MRWRRRTSEGQGQHDFGWANVSLRGDVIYVQSYSRHPDGPYIANQWLRVLGHDADDTAIGQVVLEALRNSQDGVKRLQDGREQAVAALLHAAGVRSYRKFVTGTRAIDVSWQPHSPSIAFVPFRNGGPSGPDRGFHSIQELEFDIPADSTDADVGRATRTALAQAL